MMNKAETLLEYIKARYQTTNIVVTGYNVPSGTTMVWIKDEWMIDMDNLISAGYTMHDIVKFALMCIKSELQYQVIQSYNM